MPFIVSPSRLRLMNAGKIVQETFGGFGARLKNAGCLPKHFVKVLSDRSILAATKGG